MGHGPITSLLVVASCVFSVARAASVTIDFNDATPGGPFTATYSEDGFRMQSISGHYDIYPAGGTADSRYFGLDQLDAYSLVKFTASDGGPFNLRSLYVLYGASPEIGEDQRLITSAGGNVSLDTVGAHAFFGPEWSNLSWFTLGSNVNIAGPGFDDLVLETVPLPAAAWLLLSGLAGLGALGRRRP